MASTDRVRNAFLLDLCHGDVFRRRHYGGVRFCNGNAGGGVVLRPGGLACDHKPSQAARSRIRIRRADSAGGGRVPP